MGSPPSHTLVVPPHPVRSSAAHLEVRSGDLEQRGLVPSPRWAPGLGLGAFSVFTDFSRQPHEAGVYPHQHHRPHFTEDTQRAAKRPTPGQTAARGRGATDPGSLTPSCTSVAPLSSLQRSPWNPVPTPHPSAPEGVPDPQDLTLVAWLLLALHPSNSPPEDELERNEAPAAACTVGAKCRVQQGRALGEHA